MAADDGWGDMARADGVGIGSADDAEQRRPVGDVDTLTARWVRQEQLFGKLRAVVTLFEADAGVVLQLTGSDALTLCQGMVQADVETGREGAERRKFQLVFFGTGPAKNFSFMCDKKRMPS